MPSTESKPRRLPAKRNALMSPHKITYEDLVKRRRLGQTPLTPKMMGLRDDGSYSNLGAFDYASLRAPLPKGIKTGVFPKGAPGSYFLMRRSSDGYISATGMFKAAFPYAEHEEEEEERAHVRSHAATSHQEVAGNIWVAPALSVDLADDYGITDWILALLDPVPMPLSESQTNTSPLPDPVVPPRWSGHAERLRTHMQKSASQNGTHKSQTLSAPSGSDATDAPSITPPRRSRRSASPTKAATRKVAATPRRRTAKVTASQTTETTLVDSFSSVPEEPATGASSVVTADDKEEAVIEDTVAVTTEEKTPAVYMHLVEEEPSVRINVDREIKVDADGVEVKHTSVAIDLPLAGGAPPSKAEAKRMIEEAKKMVESVAAEEKKADAVVSTKSKRKADDIAADDEGGDEAGASDEKKEGEAAEASRPAKRVRTQEEVKREQIKKRALLGISITAGIAASIPYVLPWVQQAIEGAF